MTTPSGPGEVPPDPDLLGLVDRFLARHRRAGSAIRSAEDAALRVVEASGPSMILIRDGMALVPFEDATGRGLHVRRYRDLDIEAHHDSDERALKAVAVLMAGGEPSTPDVADLLTLARLATDSTEEEAFRLVDDLGRLGDVEPPREIVDLVKLLNRLLGDRRRSTRDREPDHFSNPAGFPVGHRPES